MKRPRLRLLVVAADSKDAGFASRVLEDHGDEVLIASDVPDALNLVARSNFDVALVSLSLPRGDGLALVHHLRALHPGVDVLVMATADDLAEAQHAMALGVLATVMVPLTGDGIMVAVDRARERRVLIRERHRLAAEGVESRRRSATYARCAAFVAETNPHVVAQQILEACAAELHASVGAIYLPQGSRCVRAVSLGPPDAMPERLSDDEVGALDPSTVVIEKPGAVWVVLVGETELSAIVSIVPTKELTTPCRESLEVVAGIGTAALAAARKVDGVARTGIKDPETSAYTFAYFGDVAGREIDRAARHDRKFSLLTLGLDGAVSSLGSLRQVADALLEAVRDSDVVARVEGDEFYLLLPETGLLGALACRRRIAQRLATLDQAISQPATGIAVFPSDGRDLGRLLRASRRRAERSKKGVWRRLELGRRPFWGVVDRLLGTEEDASIGANGAIELHPDLRAAHDPLARHAILPRSLLPRIAKTVVQDAVVHGLRGTVYAAGDASVASTVAQAMSDRGSPLRAWCLGDAGAFAGERFHIAVDDRRVDGRVLLLSLTDVGGYSLIARPLDRHRYLAYHASDLDLVDGMVRALQDTYHLQPEVPS